MEAISTMDTYKREPENIGNYTKQTYAKTPIPSYSPASCEYMNLILLTRKLGIYDGA